MALGSILRDYLVSCAADGELLRELMKQARYQHAAAVITPFGAPPHSIPLARRPANGFLALLDVVKVHDESAQTPVLNYLIDK